MPVELPAELFEDLRGVLLLLMSIDAKLEKLIRFVDEGGDDEEEADS